MKINGSDVAGISGDLGDDHGETKAVDLRVVLAITTGRLNFSTSGEKNKVDRGALNSVLEWMTGKKPSGSTLDDVTNHCSSHLLKQFPNLEQFKTALPELDLKLITSKNPIATTAEWLAKIAKKAGVGDVLNVPKLPEGTFKPPTVSAKELEELKALEVSRNVEHVIRGPEDRSVGQLFKAMLRSFGISSTRMRESMRPSATSPVSGRSNKLAEDISHQFGQLLRGYPMLALKDSDPSLVQAEILCFQKDLSRAQSGGVNAMRSLCAKLRNEDNHVKSLAGFIMLCMETGITSPEDIYSIVSYQGSEQMELEVAPSQHAYLNTKKFLDDIGWSDIRNIR